MRRPQSILVVIAACVTAIAIAPLAGHVAGAAHEPRRGVVRLEGRAVRDDGGVFNPLGATMFWLAWGYKFDRPRLEANLQALRDVGVDYIRALGDVGPGSDWADREIDPAWPDYAGVIEGATDLAYDRFGLRVQWTIFGGHGHLKTEAARAALVDRFAGLARTRAHKIFALEIANEGWKNGFDGPAGTVEMRGLGKRLAAATDVLVAISAPPGGDTAFCDLYAGAGVDIATIHYDRDRAGPTGAWGPVWQPARPRAPCATPAPAAVLNNEPVGPGSSNDEERDPLRLALSYLTTFLGGNAAYVLHAAPGIRGGGAGDRALGRAADFTAVPEFNAVRHALVTARRSTPAGLANWKPVAGDDLGLTGLDDAVKRGSLVRAIFAAEGPRRFGVLLGVSRDIQLRASSPVEVELIDPVSGGVLTRAVLAAGQTFEVPPRPRDGGDGLVVRVTRQ